MKHRILLAIAVMLSFYMRSFAQVQTNTATTMDTIRLTETVVYGSLHAVNSTPFSFSNLTTTDFATIPAAEPTYTLASTPSVTFSTDNGTNMGYSYYRLRGMDQTRINVTVNGVPLNEPEDQGSYLNNFPNFLSAISGIQIVRGVGMSKVGSVTFGGSINFDTKFNGDGVGAYTSFGSYNTTVQNFNIGDKGFFVNGTHFKTDGYKYYSGNESWSTTYGSSFRFLGQDVKLFGMIGKQENGMAWVGETMDQIRMDPRSNTNSRKEKDRFVNVHNQLTFINRSLGKSTITYTLFHQYQDGWYDTNMGLFVPVVTPLDVMSRIKLRFNWFGAMYNQRVDLGQFKLDVGADYYDEIRDHTGSDNIESHGYIRTYSNTGLKQELSQYAKVGIDVNGITLYGDVQNRYVNHLYRSDQADLRLYDGDHINWSAGSSTVVGVTTLHIGIGHTFREPRRSDILGGYDVYAGELNDLTDESVTSYDLGMRIAEDNVHTSINAYCMDFTNELMPTGGYGVNGIALFTNVERSYRRGVELSTDVRIGDVILDGEASVSSNRFYNAGHAWKKSILSPWFISRFGAVYRHGIVAMGLSMRCNARSFIDISNEYDVPGYVVMDGWTGMYLGNIGMKLNVNNILNSRVLTGGNTGVPLDGYRPRYYVMSGTFSLVTVSMKL